MSASACPNCRDRIEELEEQIRQLSDQLAPESFSPPMEWGLTGSQVLIMRALCTRKVVSRNYLVACFEAKYVDWAADPKVIDVQICKMRQRLAAFGLKINTQWAQGYSLDDDQRPEVLAACMGLGAVQIGNPIDRPRAQNLTPLLLKLLEQGSRNARELAAEAARVRPNTTLDTVSALLTTMYGRGLVERSRYDSLESGVPSMHYRLPGEQARAA